MNLISIPGILLAAAFGWLLLSMRREVEPVEVDDDLGFGEESYFYAITEDGVERGDAEL